MSVERLLEKLDRLDKETMDLRTLLEEHGTSVVFEVDFVGGTRPVDTPHTSAGHVAQDLLNQFSRVTNDPAFQDAISNAEVADEQYEAEYAEARRDLDLGPRRY